MRITAELLAGLSALERTPDLRVLMFYGPLIYLVGSYAGHSPFTEQDIDSFLRHYGGDPAMAHALKNDFLQQARLDIYPRMTERSDEWVCRRLFEPLAFMAFLDRRLLEKASQRTPPVLVMGVVERGRLREFTETILLVRVFRGLRAKGNIDYFNKMYGRSDLTSPKTLLDRLVYDDALLMAMLLQPGQYSELWTVNKFGGLRRGHVTLPSVLGEETANFEALKPGPFGFPRVCATYLHVSEITEPVRIELFDALATSQMVETVRRVYLYSRLLPSYGFPVGLAAIDKYAHIPTWMTEAYGKLIWHHLGVSL